MRITYYGHSCFAAQIKNRTLLFDPYITENELAKSVDVEKVSADYIFISHAHSDHTGDVIRIAKRTGALVIANFEVAGWCEKNGASKVQAMNHGGTAKLDFGSVKLVNAIHTSSFDDGSYGGNPVGFVVESSEGNFYHSGDTALTLDMKLIAETTKLNFAGLCIGDNFTMGIDDAIRAADFVGVTEVIGLHYDTFPPIKIDHKAAIAKFAAKGKKLYLLKPGETHDF